MKILILGAGRVGRSVAETLVSDANDITIVDESAERIALMQERPQRYCRRRQFTVSIKQCRRNGC